MSIKDVARKFRVREVLEEDAWYLEITNDLRIMVVTSEEIQYDPIVKIENISEESLSVVTELGKEHNLKFENLKLLNSPTIRAIRCISSITLPAQSTPILLALYDMSGIIYREIFTFGSEPLRPEKVVLDYAYICEVQDKEVLCQAARYILNSQKK